ncbi:MAG: hypothetical protein AUJ56_05060 [Zetaproteobacteria bacterium CG1_02_49_23]|nr:MAG: hypothetical protein AUJ56_05060 [Zetaproteobacteria bacterium CG1_02_49_23]
MLRTLLMLLLLSVVSGCATVQNDYDPIQKVNRVTDSFNNNLDKMTLKPLAKGYRVVTNQPIRDGVSNFFDNATYMNTVLNSFLQGKVTQGFSDFGRFVVNTTVGIGGIADVATSMGMEKHQEDLGQTLAVWGFTQGAYIEYPLLGPNSVRNTPDFVTSTGTDALFWASFALAPVVTIPLTVLKFVDKRSRLEEAANMRDELALDSYIFTREAWRQHRQYLIYDGHPPEGKQQKGQVSDDDFGFDD